ncbi:MULTISPECIES: Arc family DNA-binding protein [Acinetobacter]|uniref:Arc family DNA-binding protein n=1 Tax=Acinetobacter TaxID=469 RepID=UPI00211DFCB1|nr:MULTISPECIES: Arc family DNA-binding protein [unclassified Acinetobacter]
MAQEYSQVNFRIPSKLKEDIEKAASANNRSITSELVSRLEESFKRDAGSIADYEKTVQKMLFNVMANLHKEGVQIEVIDEAMDKAINDIDCDDEKKPT